MKWKRLNFIDRIKDTTVRNGWKGAILAVWMLTSFIHKDDPEGNLLCFIPHFCPAAQAAEKERERPKYREMPLVFPGHGKGPDECTCRFVAHFTADGEHWHTYSSVAYPCSAEPTTIRHPAFWFAEWTCTRPPNPQGHWTIGRPRENS